MRMFSGLGGPEDTNKRFHYLLNHGETGLSIAFHYPTLMGYDSDSPMSRGESRKCGVAIDTLKDMEILFEGIPLDKVTTSMTINPAASILLSMYIVVAETGGKPKRNWRDHPERHAEGIHCPEDLHASAQTVASDHCGYHRVLHEGSPPLEYDQHQWLPYS